MNDSRQDFFGRTATLELLKKRVLDIKEGYRQNIAILGNRYIGKTALLHHFLSNLDEENVTTIYLDIENKDFRLFLEKFTGRLLYNYSISQQLPAHEDVDLLLETTKDSIPHTVQVIRKIYKDYQAKKMSTCFLGLLALPEIFTNETGRFCVLILDEFQHLEEFPVPNVFQHLGKKIMTQKRCLYVVASSCPATAKKILSEKLFLLFGNFEVVALEPFDPHTSRQFIETALQQIEINGSLQDFLVDFTAGYPLYLHLICVELVRLSMVHQQREIFIPLLAKAAENVIFNRWGAISRHFELIVGELASIKSSRIMTAVLMALANDCHKTEEVCAALGLGKAQVNSKINRLMEAGFIAKNGNFYYFRDKLFKYWTKYVFQERLRYINLEPERRREQFQKEFCRLMEGFKINTCKDLSSRIIELLHCFDHEAFDLNGRKYKLPLFREIVALPKTQTQDCSLDMIKASTIDDVWLIAVKDKNVSEAEINTLLEESRKDIQKPQRCLLIFMKTLDENARLRAMQERFWIWSEKEINTLLTLFNKPSIAR